MAELAKLKITVTDNSFYGSGTGQEIPLFLIATKENKIISDSGEIAKGTTKEMAKELVILTSRKDCTDWYGIPYFEENDGSINQASELNESGLFGLYDSLGSSSVAYAIRADIDTAQLEPKFSEPVGKVGNGTKWLDESISHYGIFRANGNSRASVAWDKVGDILFPTDEDMNVELGVPEATFGMSGDVAVYNNGERNIAFENIDGEWYLIGSDAWKSQLNPHSNYFKVTETIEPNSTFVIKTLDGVPNWVENTEYNVGDMVYVNNMGKDYKCIQAVTAELSIKTFVEQLVEECWEEVEPTSITVTITGTAETITAKTIAQDVITAINEQGTTTLTVYPSVETITDKFRIQNGNSIFELVDGVNSPLEKIGGNTVYPNLIFSPHTKVPDGSNAGSIWVKTTEPNYGFGLSFKTYVANTDSWNEKTIHLYKSYLDAEKEFGNNLSGTSYISKYDDENKIDFAIKKYVSGKLKATGSVNPTVLDGNKFIIKTVENATIKTATIITSGTSIDSLIRDINKAFGEANITTMLATKEEDTDGFKLVVISNSGKSFVMIDEVGTTVTDCGFISGFEYTLWDKETVVYEASEDEPYTDADFGTLWFVNDMLVDILVNTGTQWKAFNSYYGENPSTDDNNCHEILIASETPIQHTDGSSLLEGDLWIDSAAPVYPTMYKFIDGDWELIDNTDQTTPDGILFADARQNAGPKYKNGDVYSKHTPFSVKTTDLRISDYVDPNCPDPRTYPAGMILFNMMASGNNVKRFENTFENAVKEYGETFVVGDENNPRFATPGTEANPVTTRWETASGKAEDGAGYFGNQAQRIMIIRAMQEALASNDDIRSYDYDFFFALAPGYPELDDDFISLNTDRQEMFYTISDTPKTLKPIANDITKWATNAYGAVQNNEYGRVTRNTYMTRQYPPMGYTSNIDGNNIAIPTSIVKLRNLLTTPRGQIAAGTGYGQLLNASSVGYISDEKEYNTVSVKDGLGEIIVGQAMNPIMTRRNTGLMFWGENTEQAATSSLSDEHSVLTLLRLKRELESVALPYFFKINTESLRNDFNKDLTDVLVSYIGRDEIYDFVVVTDSSINTPETINRKELHAQIAIELSKSVEFIFIPISCVSVGELSGR